MKAPDIHPSQPGSDPHSSTEEIGRAERPHTPQAPKTSRNELELEELRRVNNGIHDGDRYVRR